MTKKGKPFKDTVVYKGLVSIAKIVRPELGRLIEGSLDIGTAIKHVIEDEQLTAEQKQHFKNEARRLEIEEFELEMKDRDSARQREANVIAAGGSDVMFKLVGILVFAAFITLLVILFFSNIDLGKYEGLVNIVFGAILTWVGAVVNYYFGSSVGSAKKTQMMNK